MSDLFNAFDDLENLGKRAERVKAALKNAPEPKAKPVKKEMSWTDEQLSIIKDERDQLNVIALAGTGKTSLLSEYAVMRPMAKWRYLTFNKALAEVAPQQLPKKVRVSTFHALAFAQYGMPLGQKLNKRFNPEVVARLVGWYGVPGWEVAVAALREWRKAFMASSSDTPALHQLPVKTWAWIASHPSGILTKIDGANGFERAIKIFWEATINPLKEHVDAPLDVTVKLMAMANAPWWADGLLVDEAQDMSDCIAQAIKNQKVPIVAVGDPSQTLYSWKNGGSSWPNEGFPVRSLTGSFRFGDEVAHLANCALGRLEGKDRLTGLNPYGGVSMIDGCPIKKGTTWIARTQAGAWQGMMEALEEGLKPSWFGKGTLERLYSVIDLAKGRNTRNPWLAGINSIEELEEAVDSTGDLEWKSAIRLIKKRGADRIDEALKASSSGVEPDVKVTTVHQSKGQTFGRVRLADDLKFDSGDDEEWKVNYVALTRSANLEVSESMKEKIEIFSERKVEDFTDHTLDDGF